MQSRPVWLYLRARLTCPVSQQRLLTLEVEPGHNTGISLSFLSTLIVGAMSEYHVRESSESTSPKVKKAPQSSSIPTPFTYFPSDDGTDENLLILLHGLGEC